MVFKNILVPTDGSEYTKAAVRKAMELAKLAGGKVTALYVLDQTILTFRKPLAQKGKRSKRLPPDSRRMEKDEPMEI